MNLSRVHKISTITKREDIKLVMNRGQKLYTKFGLIFMLKNPDEYSLKLAVLLKKNVGSAVKRNYVKRINKYFYVKNFDIFRDFNWIIFLYKYQGKVNYKDLEEEYKSVLSKI